ncbi:MAG: hypothetical protein AB8B96_03260 [Lysobacterales bacterium]
MACLTTAPLVNYPLTLLSFGVLGIAVLVLWRPTEPPLTMLIVMYQWLQGSTKLLHANLTAVPLDDMLVEGSFGESHPVTGALSEATAYTLWGLLALIAGLALAQRGERGRHSKPPLTPAAVGDFPSLSRNRLVTGTLFAIAGSLILSRLQYLLPGGLTQIILPLINFKWALIFALACSVLRDRQGYAWLVAICGLEVLLGFAAYFSAWKEVILVIVLAYFFCRPSFELKRVAAGAGLVALGLTLAVFWTAIKVEQRLFLNEGTGQQVITRGTGESLANAFDLAAATDAEEYRLATLRLAERVAYVDYFANTLVHVPQVRPHENGQLWWQAITHVFTPRIFFPNKPALQSDSEQTMYYTGLLLASSFEGASISLGYMAESYIDFGVPGMFVPIFLWGLLVGLSLNQLVTRYGQSDLVWGAGVVIILSTLILEVSAVKMVGGTLMSILVMFALLKFIGADLAGWIYPKKRKPA